ncbi:Crp/Fnr family transcriptional regulator [Candidatus Poribacteria bacterium]|nr:Crp/Fnr family transcriptional regulator [Candidatus Poribacteria bacterium]
MLDLIHQHFWCIKHIDMYKDLSDDDSEALDKIIKYSKLKHEEQLSREGVYIIKEGRIKVSEKTKEDNISKKIIKNRINSDSQESPPDEPTTLEVLEPGEIIGINIDDDEDINPLISIVTLTEVCVGFVSIRDFLFFLKRKPHLVVPSKTELYRKLVTTFSRYLPLSSDRRSTKEVHNILKRNSMPDNRRHSTLSDLAFRSGSSRLAFLIQNLATQPEINGIICIQRISTKTISKLIGCSVETTEKLLNSFKQYKILNLRWRKIQILNLWNLKKIADSRFMTLATITQESTTTPEELDFQALINPQDNNRIQSNSVAPIK